MASQFYSSGTEVRSPDSVRGCRRPRVCCRSIPRAAPQPIRARQLADSRRPAAVILRRPLHERRMDTFGSVPRKVWPRFDGVRFAVYNGENEAGILNKYVTVLNVDQAGRLWIGTRSGVTVLEKGKFTPYAGSAALAHAYVHHAIVEDKSGHMWVGTESGLFEIAGGGNASTFGASSGLRDVRIQSLLGRPRRGTLGRHCGRPAALRRQALRRRHAARQGRRGCTGHGAARRCRRARSGSEPPMALSIAARAISSMSSPNPGGSGPSSVP